MNLLKPGDNVTDETLLSVLREKGLRDMGSEEYLNVADRDGAFELDADADYAPKFDAIYVSQGSSAPLRTVVSLAYGSLHTVVILVCIWLSCSSSPSSFHLR